MLHLREARDGHRHLLLADARGQHAVAAPGQPVKDFHEMLGAFAGSKDHLGHAHAQRAMMIHLGKAEIFKGESFDLVERGIGSNLPGAHLLQQGFQSIRIHIY